MKEIVKALAAQLAETHYLDCKLYEDGTDIVAALNPKRAGKPRESYVTIHNLEEGITIVQRTHMGDAYSRTTIFPEDPELMPTAERVVKEWLDATRCK